MATTSSEQTQGRANDHQVVDEQNPWPGLASYHEADHEFFRGREAETDALARMVDRDNLSLVFGRSGLGKTSLLQAGLFPVARAQGMLPVYIRLDFSEGHESLTAQVKAAIGREVAAHRVDGPAAQDGETLWEHFHHKGREFWSARNRPLTPLLVFDQFEEVFTRGRRESPAETAAFLEELADLVEGRAPDSLKARLEQNPKQAAGYTFREHHYHTLISLREEWLPDLEDLRLRMPSIMHNRLRLFQMSREAALSVVQQGGDLIGEATAKLLVAEVAQSPDAGSDDGQVEPALLSLMCRQLNRRRIALEQPRITDELVATAAKRVLADFYDESIAGKPEAVREFIEEELLTKDEFRDQVRLEKATQRGIREQVVDELVDCRLLRREQIGKLVKIELMHDRLTKVVGESRRARHQQEKEAAAKAAVEESRREAERVRREAELERQQARTRLRYALLAIGMVVSLLAWNLVAEARANQQRIEKLEATDLPFAQALLDAAAKPWPRGESQEYATNEIEDWLDSVTKLRDRIRSYSETLQQAAAGELAPLRKSRLEQLVAYEPKLSQLAIQLPKRLQAIERRWPLWQRRKIPPQDGLLPADDEDLFYVCSTADLPWSDAGVNRPVVLRQIPAADDADKIEFFVSKYEVTLAQYRRWRGNPIDATAPADEAARKRADVAADMVSWHDANAFCLQHGLQLPSKEQWQRCAVPKPDMLEAIELEHLMAACVLDLDVGKGPLPVGSKAPVGDQPEITAANDFGLLDTYGNVREWSADDKGGRTAWAFGENYLCPPAVILNAFASGDDLTLANPLPKTDEKPGTGFRPFRSVPPRR